MSTSTYTDGRTLSKTVFVYRKGNGGAHVAPPVFLARLGETFWVVNLTECEVKVTFPRITDPESAVLGPKGSGKEQALFRVLPEVPPAFYEYDAILTCARQGMMETQYAYGSSRPGVIIDR